MESKSPKNYYKNYKSLHMYTVWTLKVYCSYQIYKKMSLKAPVLTCRFIKSIPRYTCIKILTFTPQFTCMYLLDLSALIWPPHLETPVLTWPSHLSALVLTWPLFTLLTLTPEFTWIHLYLLDDFVLPFPDLLLFRFFLLLPLLPVPSGLGKLCLQTQCMLFRCFPINYLFLKIAMHFTCMLNREEDSTALVHVLLWGDL